MKHIYVSPHADDVALSCGGQIIANLHRKDEILVLNMFTSESGSSGSRLFDSVNSARTAEDRSAWDHIGVETVYADLPEALLRKQFPFEIRGRVRDDKVVSDICGIIADCAPSHPDAVFHFPAGIGSHVDHLACKRAAFRLLDEGRLDRIILYEDVPYSWLRFIRDQYYKALVHDVELDAGSRTTAFRGDGESLSGYLRGKQIPFPRGKKLFPLVYLSLRARNPKSRPTTPTYRGRLSTVALNADQLARKKQLIDHYRTQIPMLFGDDPDKLLDRFHTTFSTEFSLEVTRART